MTATAADAAARALSHTQAWDARLERMLQGAPLRLRRWIAWLRRPDRRLPRRLAGLILILGGLLSILPVLGLWMLPLGLALLGEDHAALKARWSAPPAGSRARSRG